MWTVLSEGSCQLEIHHGCHSGLQRTSAKRGETRRWNQSRKKKPQQPRRHASYSGTRLWLWGVAPPFFLCVSEDTISCPSVGAHFALEVFPYASNLGFFPISLTVSQRLVPVMMCLKHSKETDFFLSLLLTVLDILVHGQLCSCWFGAGSGAAYCGCNKAVHLRTGGKQKERKSYGSMVECLPNVWGHGADGVGTES